MPVEAYDREQRRKLASGTLLTIDNQIDPTTGTVRLKAQFPNTDDRLFPNQFVNARLLLDVKRGATRGARRRPSSAAPQGPFVYVVTPDQTVDGPPGQRRRRPRATTSSIDARASARRRAWSSSTAPTRLRDGQPRSHSKARQRGRRAGGGP